MSAVDAFMLGCGVGGAVVAVLVYVIGRIMFTSPDAVDEQSSV